MVLGNLNICSEKSYDNFRDILMFAMDSEHVMAFIKPKRSVLADTVNAIAAVSLI